MASHYILSLAFLLASFSQKALAQRNGYLYPGTNVTAGSIRQAICHALSPQMMFESTRDSAFVLRHHATRAFPFRGHATTSEPEHECDRQCLCIEKLL